MAPSGVRNDGNVPKNTSGTTTKGTAVTIPLRRDLFQMPGSIPGSGRQPSGTSTSRTAVDIPVSRSKDGDVTISLSARDGSRRTLQQIAESQGMTVKELLSAPSNSNLKGLYENQIQMMLDKYRTYEHQLKRAVSQPLVENQVANDSSWIPTDVEQVHVPSRKAPDSSERLLDEKQVDKSELEALVAKVPDDYKDVVKQALGLSQSEGAEEEEGVDLEELYTDGQDCFPQDAKLMSFLYGQNGMRMKAANNWSVGCLRQSMKEVNLREGDPNKLPADTIKPGMLVTSWHKSRIEMAYTGIVKDEKGRKGIWVVAPNRKKGSGGRSSALTREFRPLSDLHTAGYPDTRSL